MKKLLICVAILAAPWHRVWIPRSKATSIRTTTTWFDRIHGAIIECRAQKLLWGVVSALLMFACNKGSDGTAVLLRTFDALCIATRLDEEIFHAQVSLFRDAIELPDDDLNMLSPNNIAGYYFPGGEREGTVAVVGLTQVDEVSSKSCGIMSRSVGFEEAVALIASHFPVENVDQFDQGVNRFVTFQGYLAGYPDNMAISVQGGEGVTGVYLYELASGGP